MEKVQSGFKGDTWKTTVLQQQQEHGTQLGNCMLQGGSRHAELRNMAPGHTQQSWARYTLDPGTRAQWRGAALLAHIWCCFATLGAAGVPIESRPASLAPHSSLGSYCWPQKRPTNTKGQGCSGPSGHTHAGPRRRESRCPSHTRQPARSRAPALCARARWEKVMDGRVVEAHPAACMWPSQLLLQAASARTLAPSKTNKTPIRAPPALRHQQCSSRKSCGHRAYQGRQVATPGDIQDVRAPKTSPAGTPKYSGKPPQKVGWILTRGAALQLHKHAKLLHALHAPPRHRPLLQALQRCPRPPLGLETQLHPAPAGAALALARLRWVG